MEIWDPTYECMPREELEQLQLERLQATLNRAYKNVTCYRHKFDANGIIPENGDAALKGLVFDIEVYSKDDGSLLRKYTGVSYDSGSIDINKHAIIVQNGQFKALDVGGTGA